MPVFGLLPLGGVLPTRASSVWWLALEILMAAAVWYLLLLEGSPTALPRISSLCALIWGRPLPLLASLLGAAMVVVGEQMAEGDLDSTDGSRAQPQWRLFTWSFVFIVTLLLLQAEGRPPFSSLPVCFMGGSYNINSEFVARRRCYEGTAVPSDSFPAMTMPHLVGCCLGPDCNSCFQPRVLPTKIRDVGVIFWFFESLYELCAVLLKLNEAT